MDPDPELFRYIVPRPDSTFSKKKKRKGQTICSLKMLKHP